MFFVRGCTFFVRHCSFTFGYASFHSVVLVFICVCSFFVLTCEFWVDLCLFLLFGWKMSLVADSLSFGSAGISFRGWRFSFGTAHLQFFVDGGAACLL